METTANLMTVSITYDVVTPESAEEGDYAESGFELEPQSITPDEIYAALCEYETLEAAVESLLPVPCGYSGVRGAFYNGGDGESFYSCDSSENYRTGESTSYAIHLNNWPPALLEVAARILTA